MGLRRRTSIGFFASILAIAAAASAQAPLPASAGAEAFVLFHALADEGRLVDARSELDRALAASPDDAYVHAEAARFLMRMGQLGAAAQQADEALRCAPSSPDVLRVAGQVFMTQVEREPTALAKARSAFEALRASRPGDLEALISLGQIFLGSGDPARAVEVLKEALSFYPQHPMVLAMLADASRAAKDSAGAELALTSLVGLAPDRLEARVELADLLIERGAARDAVVLLSAAPPSQVATAEVTRRLALASYQAGDLPGAMRALDLLLAERPDFGGGHYLKGMVLLAEGRAEEAAVELDTLRQADPKNPELAAVTARAFDRSGATDRAAEILATLEEHLTEQKQTAEALEIRLERADLLSRHGRLDDALALTAPPSVGAGADVESRRALGQARTEILARLERWDEALELATASDLPEPGKSGLRAELLFRAHREREAGEVVARLVQAADAASLTAAAEALQRVNRHAEALPILEKARVLEPESPRLAFQLGVSLERTGRIQDAIAELSRAVEKAPQFAAALNYLAYLLAEAGVRLEDAAAMAEKALGISPESGAYVDTLGWIRYRQGDLATAKVLIERAVRLVGDDATLFEHLGEVLAALGDREGALRSFDKSLAIGPENRAAVELKRKALASRNGS